MHTLGRFYGAQRTVHGDLIVSFTVANEQETIEQMEKLKDKTLVLDIDKFKQARSGEANRYFWQLVDKIAQVLGANRMDIYIIRLRHDGVFLDVNVPKSSLPSLERSFRWVEVFDDGHLDVDSDDTIWVRCYIGSSHYNTAEMSRLIEGTVEQAKELGIETLTPAELERMVAAWQPNRR